MKEDHRTSKVEILIQQKKYSEAERILSSLLTEDANNIAYLSLLSEVKLQQDKYGEANQIISIAIGLSPSSPYLYYIKARIAIQREMLSEAEDLLKTCIELNPFDADYHALLANIKLSRKRFSEALEIADEALKIDAENLLALNTRSTALNKLNRSKESFDTIEGALRGDPNNAYTHSNYGWGLLEKGNHKKALEHFKEALSNDPNLANAQLGMLEALKASNLFYRLFLKYSFWIGNLTAKYQWGVLIGFYLSTRALIKISDDNPSLESFLLPLIICLGLIAFSTWIITPVSNLFLRFNKYGQLLLDKKEKTSSNLVAISIGICVAGLTLFFALEDEKMLTIAAFGLLIMLPLGTMLSPSKNNGLMIYTVVLIIVGLIAIGETFSTGELFNTMSSLFILGFVGFQWVANAIIIKEDNR